MSGPRWKRGTLAWSCDLLLYLVRSLCALQVIGVRKFDRRNRVDVLTPSVQQRPPIDSSAPTDNAVGQMPTHLTSIPIADGTEHVDQTATGSSDMDATTSEVMTAYQEVVEALMGSGWPWKVVCRAICIARAGLSTGVSSTYQPSVESVRYAALGLLLHGTAVVVGMDMACVDRLCVLCMGMFGCEGGLGAAANDQGREVWNEEVESLEAIFDSHFEVSSLPGPCSTSADSIDANACSSWLQSSEVARLSMMDRCEPLPEGLQHWGGVDSSALSLEVWGMDKFVGLLVTDIACVRQCVHTVMKFNIW